ncbi:hypothetical protein DRW03_04255 [Corallococcus sp. H22C18031201]|nr:hypothetical protein DRW03_04255 [Corallococcus sp. H22C18031201]
MSLTALVTACAIGAVMQGSGRGGEDGEGRRVTAVAVAVMQAYDLETRPVRGPSSSARCAWRKPPMLR